MRFDAPLIVTSSIGFRCIGTSPRHILIPAGEAEASSAGAHPAKE
jgi:hypothetical protein